MLGISILETALSWSLQLNEFPREERGIFSTVISCSRFVSVTVNEVFKFQFGSLALIVLELVDLIYAVHQWRLNEDVFGVHILTPIILCISFVSYHVQYIHLCGSLHCIPL